MRIDEERSTLARQKNSLLKSNAYANRDNSIALSSRDESRAMTRSISAASQPTEDENGGARRNRTKELQKAYLATCTKKVKEEEEEEKALRSFRPRVTEHIVDTIKGNVLNNNLAAGRAFESCVHACLRECGAFACVSLAGIRIANLGSRS